MREAVLLVSLLLALTVPLHRAGVSLTVAFPIITVFLTPLVRALQARLAVDGIAGDLLAVIVAATSSLAVSLATSKLARVIRGRLKDLLAVTAVTIAHRRLRRLGVRSLCAEAAPDPKPPAKLECDVETAIEFSYRVPADGGKTKGDLETAVEDFFNRVPADGAVTDPGDSGDFERLYSGADREPSNWRSAQSSQPSQ